jgi:peptidoglycan/LPS O-acetylase OafA/YrhL
VASGWSLLCFIAMVPVARLSYRCAEEPFLRLRKRYVRTIGETAQAGLPILTAA